MSDGPEAPVRATARDLVAVAAAALAVRLLALWTVWDAVFFRVLQTEPLRYHQWAVAWLHGEALRPPYEEAPGFVAAVAAIYAAVGPRPVAIACANAAFDAITAAAVAGCAARLAGRPAGWVAGGAFVLYGPSVVASWAIEPTSLAAAAVALALLATPTQGPGGWARAGAAWAAAALVRTELLLAVPIVALHAGLGAGGRAAARVAAVPVLLVALSTAANLAASGRPVLTTTGAGANLWIGNGPLADGVNPFVAGPRAAEARRVVGDATDAATADRRLLAAARAHAAAHPALVARLALRKLAWTFTTRELPNAADLEWLREQSPLLGGPVPFGFGALFPAACVGVVLLGPRWRAALPLAGPIVAATVVGVVFFTNARFRGIAAPPLAVLTGVAWIGLLEVRGPPVDVRGLVRAAAAWLAASALAHADIDGVRTYRIPQIDMNTASLELRSGRVPEGLARLQRAVAAAPTDPAGWIQLATALEAAGEPTGAARAWRDAERHLPRDPEVARGAAAFRDRRRRRRAPTPPPRHAARTPEPAGIVTRRFRRGGSMRYARTRASEVRRCG